MRHALLRWWSVTKSLGPGHSLFVKQQSALSLQASGCSQEGVAVGNCTRHPQPGMKVVKEEGWVRHRGLICTVTAVLLRLPCCIAYTYMHALMQISLCTFCLCVCGSMCLNFCQTLQNLANLQEACDLCRAVNPTTLALSMKSTSPSSYSTQTHTVYKCKLCADLE